MTTDQRTQSGPACSVCAQSMGDRQGAQDAKGRPVCGACIEAARQLVARRESQRRRVAALKQSEEQLAQVEHDNSAVLAMTEAEVLALARFACPSCGRVMPVAGMGCPTCVHATTHPATKRRFLRSGFSAGSSRESRLFPALDARLVALIGVLLLSLAALAPVGPLLAAWLWSAAVLVACAITVTGLALLALARRSAPASVAAPAVGMLVGVGMFLWNLHDPTRASLPVWLAVGLPALLLQAWSLASSHDEWLVRRAATATLVVHAGLLAVAVVELSRASKV